MRAKKGMPPYLELETKHAKNEQAAFHSKCDKKIQVWKDKRPVQMINTIHDANSKDHWKERQKKTNSEIKKPEAVVQ